jgi:hypothetical protein
VRYNLELAPSQRESAPVAITIDCARMTELFVVILNGRDDKSTDSAASSSNVAAKRIAWQRERGKQRHSEALRGIQRHSEALKAIGGNQVHSATSI